MSMGLTSFIYLFLFLPGVFVFYHIVPLKFRPWALFLVSLVYYYLCAKKAIVLLLLAVIGVTFFTAILMDRYQADYERNKAGLDRDQRKVLKAKTTSKKKAVLAVAILLLLGSLFVCKYLKMATDTIGTLSTAAGHPIKISLIKLTLPMGISFYTLQAIGYMVDVYRNKYPASRSIRDIALFISFFPQLVEGPIGRFDLMQPSLARGHAFDYKRVTYACQRLLWGMVKVLVISNRANLFVNKVFGKDDPVGITVPIAILLYTLQIYANFSGSIDIVLGTGELFGIELSENFKQPFKSKSITEFWQRWHITLGSWLRDYLFYPISMSKAFKSLSKATKAHFSKFFGSLIPAASALFVVWLANGFWHGASWQFVCYGLYYFVLIFLGMLFEPLFQKFFDSTGINRRGSKFGIWQTVRTFILVNIGMLIFRVNELKDIGTLYHKMFKANWLTQLQDGVLWKTGMDGFDWFALLLAFAMLCYVSHLKENGHNVRDDVAALSMPIRWLIYLGLFFMVLVMGGYGEGYGVGGIIYAQF